MRLASFVLVAGCATLAGQSYDRTTWGMTRAEVEAAYPGATWSSLGRAGGPLHPGLLRQISSVQDIPVDIVFKFEGGKLAQVTVSPLEDAAGLGAASAALKLKNLLKDKYGTPTSGRQDPEWMLPTMTIKTRTLTAVAGRFFFSIIYAPRTAAAGL